MQVCATTAPQRIEIISTEYVTKIKYFYGMLRLEW
jgi:hypothetical protein